MSDWVDTAAARLAEHGYRRGGARAAVIELLDGESCALSAYDIESSLNARKGRSVGRASVYRVLDELEQLKLVTRVEVGQGIARYEPARHDHHHHHLLCSNCSEIVPFEDEQLEAVIAKLPSRQGFSVTEHEIVLRGECADCAQR